MPSTHSFCTKIRDETRELFSFDTHSPLRCLVNGVVVNNPDFTKVFKYTDNALMNLPDSAGFTFILW